VAIALYAETGGDLSFVSAQGQLRTLRVADFTFLPVGARRVRATGTTAQEEHMLVVDYGLAGSGDGEPRLAGMDLQALVHTETVSNGTGPASPEVGWFDSHGRKKFLGFSVKFRRKVRPKGSGHRERRAVIVENDRGNGLAPVPTPQQDGCNLPPVGGRDTPA